MGQLGFHVLDKRLDAISAKGDPLEALNGLIPFESFRAEIEAVVRLAPEERKSKAGRKPFDAVMMFKVLVLQTLYNLADEQVEYQIRDRLSFMRFVGLALHDAVPDAKTQIGQFAALQREGKRVISVVYRVRDGNFARFVVPRFGM